MANQRLESIVSRQRGYLIKDILMAALAGVILVLQVSVLSGPSGVSAAPERPMTSANATPGECPEMGAPSQVATMATSATAPGS